MQKNKLIRTSTVAISLDFLLKGQLAYLNKHYDVVAVSGKDQHLDEVQRREKVRTISVKMERKINPLKDLRSLWKLYFLFKKEKPYIVHSITPKAGLLSMISAKLAGVPIRIHTFTGLIFPSKNGKIQKLLILMDKILCSCATNIYPEGNGVRNDLIKYKITYKPLKVLANGNVNGIDINHFNTDKISIDQKIQVQQKLNIKKNDFVFIFVGRLVSDKGINELINAFKEMHIDYPQVKLLLVGPLETELDPLLPETLHEIEQNKAIISVGFQDDVRLYFSISDALVFPSYREGFPNVVLQAGAMELPSIVSDINGCNEIIVDGENGLIIPAKNIELLVEAMSKLVSDTNIYDYLKLNSRKRIEENYEQSLVWNALLQEYKNLESNV